jgi:hypothetical protein
VTPPGVLLVPEVVDTAACRALVARARALGLAGQRTNVGSERRRAHAEDPALAAALWSTLAPRLPALAWFYPPPLRPEPAAGGVGPASTPSWATHSRVAGRPSSTGHRSPLRTRSRAAGEKRTLHEQSDTPARHAGPWKERPLPATVPG